MSLVRERGSAKTLAAEHDVDLGLVSYHLIEVLDSRCGVVERVEKIKRRGVWEHHYAIRPTAFRRVFPWSEFPAPIRGYLIGYALEEFLELLTRAVSNGSAEALTPGSRVEWNAVEVDYHGLMEIYDGAAQFSEKVDLAVERSRQRLHKREAHGGALNMAVGLAAFQTGR